MQCLIPPTRCVVLLAVVLGLAGCGKDLASPKDPLAQAQSRHESTPDQAVKARRIVFLYQADGTSYGEACRRGAVQAGKELGISVEFQALKQADPREQVALIERFVAEKVDALVISPVDPRAVEAAIKKAMDAGIKVFTWDKDAPDSQRIFHVAGADDRQMGIDIADSLAKEIGAKGEVQIVSGNPDVPEQNRRIEGMMEGFKAYPAIKLIRPHLYADGNVEKVRSLVAGVFAQHPNVVGFACADLTSVKALGEVIVGQGKVGKVKVWGVAMPSEAKSYLEVGAVNGLALWDPMKLTYLTAILVNDFLNGRQPEDETEYPGIGKIRFENGVVRLPGILITNENILEFDF